MKDDFDRINELLASLDACEKPSLRWAIVAAWLQHYRKDLEDDIRQLTLLRGCNAEMVKLRNRLDLTRNQHQNFEALRRKLKKLEKQLQQQPPTI